MIEIRAPRYRDRKVLLARYKLPCGRDVDVRILTGAYAGVYHVTNETICRSPIETMTTRFGKPIAMRAVSLDDMERAEE